MNKEGRFPDLSGALRDPASAKARCHLSPEDRQFLAESLPKLPCDEENNCPVTLEVNGQIAIGAKAAGQSTPTELVLSNSECAGEPVRISINRKYLARALKLGLQDLCLYGDDSALLGHDDSHKYIFMPLEPGAAIEPAEDAIRIESPKGEAAATITQPVTPRKVPTMSEPTNNTNGKATTNGQAKSDTAKASRRKASQQDISGLIEQAVQFRSALHTLVQQSNGLVKALKQHRRQNKVIQTTLESLKQLKTLGV